jgi:hydrogenase small subunit
MTHLEKQDSGDSSDIDFSTEPGTVGERLANLGVSRRSFLKFCTVLTSSMALEASLMPKLAYALSSSRPCIIYMSFQDCTGCLESMVNSYGTTIENLILTAFSLDYQETLQAAAGKAAEAARNEAMAKNAGKYILVVDGSIPASAASGFFMAAGESGVDRLTKAAANAAFVMAVGSCASFGGLPGASPNPTGAVAVSSLVTNKTVVNVSGCPPIAEVITGVLAYYLANGAVPALDANRRPTMYYGKTVHSTCYRKTNTSAVSHAASFGDAGARSGGCLWLLGCKGPRTYAACATMLWNQGLSFPVQSGHGCIGCTQPGFWDMGGLYTNS